MNFLTGDPMVDFVIGFFSMVLIFSGVFMWR